METNTRRAWSIDRIYPREEEYGCISIITGYHNGNQYTQQEFNDTKEIIPEINDIKELPEYVSLQVKNNWPLPT